MATIGSEEALGGGQQRPRRARKEQICYERGEEGSKGRGGVPEEGARGRMRGSSCPMSKTKHRHGRAGKNTDG